MNGAAGSIGGQRRWTLPLWVLPIGLLALALAAVGIALSVYGAEVTRWAANEQRDVQNLLARAVMAIRNGDPAAIWTLVGLSFTYGFVHAIGPGHGKVLISGAALASPRTAQAMAGIGMAASLLQAVSAILLVYGALGLLSLSSAWAIGTTEQVLMPLSYLAMGLIGAWLAWRGAKVLAGVFGEQPGGHRHHVPGHAHDHTPGDRLATGPGHGEGHHLRRDGDHHAQGHIALHVHDAHAHNEPHGHAHSHDHDHHHEHGHDCGCKHMPTAGDIERLESPWQLAALLLSIGIRPCSGALIVLVICWRFDLLAVGALSALAMAVGTGVVVGGVGLLARHLRSWVSTVGDNAGADGAGTGLILLGFCQLLAGAIVFVLCAGLAYQGVIATGSRGVLG
ncbi:MAG: hypothetical protein AAGF32_07100 [Pseudomonadota bacterium]